MRLTANTLTSKVVLRYNILKDHTQEGSDADEMHIDA